jgi:thioredoxin reductase (NADPH)
MLVRSSGLAATMSRYLIRRIENSLNIILRPQTEIVALEGGDHLDSVYWRNSQTGQTEKHEISHVFIMTGADPNTRWLNGCIALDDKGFIKTGPDLLPENLSLQAGLLYVNHICLKPVCQMFSLWTTCVAAVSSVSRPQ